MIFAENKALNAVCNSAQMAKLNTGIIFRHAGATVSAVSIILILSRNYLRIQDPCKFRPRRLYINREMGGILARGYTGPGGQGAAETTHSNQLSSTPS